MCLILYHEIIYDVFVFLVFKVYLMYESYQIFLKAVEETKVLSSAQRA